MPNPAAFPKRQLSQNRRFTRYLGVLPLGHSGVSVVGKCEVLGVVTELEVNSQDQRERSGHLL